MIVGILFAVLVAVALGVYLLKPKAPKPAGDLASVSEMEAYFGQVVAAKHPPGLSVAVVKDGRQVYANGFGVADGPKDVAATADTVYHWWSMTKIPTAVAILQLQERGLLDIDDPIRDYLPYFRVTYKEVDQGDISIRQVLDHTAGLSNAMPELMTWLHLEGEPAVNQTQLVLDKFPDYDGLLFPPGEKAQYSNWGYVVLGALIETVSGQTYEAYIVENILSPLGMENTNLLFTESMAENEAAGSQHLIDMFTPLLPFLKLGYLVRERAGMRLWFHRVYNDQAAPTGLIGSATDVGKFLMAYLDEGGSLLQSESVSVMNSVLDEASLNGGWAQGLGWQANVTPTGRSYIGHSGGGPGFATILRVYPDEKLGVVVMGNDSSIDRETLVDVLAGMEW